jgi:hypothetical protein
MHLGGGRNWIAKLKAQCNSSTQSTLQVTRKEKKKRKKQKQTNNEK